LMSTMLPPIDRLHAATVVTDLYGIMVVIMFARQLTNSRDDLQLGLRVY